MEEVMLSALQHYAYCPRQCALIHLEQVWSENGHTMEGRMMHEHVHDSGSRMRDGMKLVTNLELRSERLGLCGRADVVEFHRRGESWQPYPVEYKKGRPHRGCDADSVQLCGQALCLEEMLGVSIQEGALYYGQTRRRIKVEFTEALRRRTEEVARAVHELLEQKVTPPPVERSGCDACSLKEECLPELSGLRALHYVQKLCGESE